MKNTSAPRRPFPVWKCLLTLAFVTGCGCLVPVGFVVVDPCAGTPGFDYTTGLVFMFLSPFLLGGLLHLLFRQQAGFRIKPFLKSVAVAAGWLYSTFAVWVWGVMMMYDIIENPNIPVSRWMYEYGCYGDKDLSDLVVILLYLVAVVVTGGLVYLIAKQRRKPRRQ